MRLDSLTRDQIRAFAGAKIFERGEEYLTSELVNELDIDSEGIVTAKAEGTDTYEAEVWEEEDDVGAVCDCPYDGHPCKHVAAVLLAYLEHSAKQRKAKTKQRREKCRFLEGQPQALHSHGTGGTGAGGDERQ